MSYAEDMGYDIGVPDWYADLDELGQETSGRLYEGEDGKPTCANCDSTNIKTSSKGNLYCADLCWAKEAEK